jgi:hypothetical protein
LKKFKFETAKLYNGNLFSGTSGAWGASFAIFTSGETVDKINFPHEVFGDYKEPVYSKYPHNYKKFEKDSIVYSLFNNSSQQSSLRNIDYKGTKWDIKNEWFWVKKDKMIELATKYGYSELINDAEASEERFVALKIEEVYSDLSKEAKDVIDASNELLFKSITQRMELSKEHPEYHLDTWDAGYAQLKLVWKQYFPEEFKEFRAKYKVLELYMQGGVYKFGFLK